MHTRIGRSRPSEPTRGSSEWESYRKPVNSGVRQVYLATLLEENYNPLIPQNSR